MTDAVIAAVKKMQAVAKGPTSIMGNDLPPLPQGLEERFDQTNRLVQRTNSSILQNEKSFGPTHLVRWGLFANDWTNFKDELAASKKLTEAFGRRHEALRKQAIEWELETSRALKVAHEVEEQAKPRQLPWKKIMLIGGGAVAAFLGLRYWLTRNEYNEEE